MKTLKISNARNSLFKLVEEVNKNHAPVQIMGSAGNAILISSDDWSAIEETLYLNAIPGLVDSILSAAVEPRTEMTPEEEIDW